MNSFLPSLLIRKQLSGQLSWVGSSQVLYAPRGYRGRTLRSAQLAQSLDCAQEWLCISLHRALSYCRELHEITAPC